MYQAARRSMEQLSARMTCVARIFAEPGGDVCFAMWPGTGAGRALDSPSLMGRPKLSGQRRVEPHGPAHKFVTSAGCVTPPPDRGVKATIAARAVVAFGMHELGLNRLGFSSRR